MTDKTNFTKDEWALLLRSPMNAGMAITAAEPSGLFGLLKESFAGGAALAHFNALAASRGWHVAANKQVQLQRGRIDNVKQRRRPVHARAGHGIHLCDQARPACDQLGLA